MKPELRRYAPLGLTLSLLGLLAAGSLYIIQREWNLYLQISLGVIVLGLAIYAILDPQKVRQTLTGRQARYGSNALVMGVAFMGILVVINYLVYKNPKRWDLTEDKQNTLAAESIDILESLTDPVTAQAFFTNRTSPETAKTLLEQYKFAGNGKFDYQFIDPEAEPLVAQEAKISRDGTVVLRMGTRQEAVDFVSETELSAAMVRLISNEVRTVYFLTGHGERSVLEAGDTSFTLIKQVLESKSYRVDALNLLTANQIPEDADVIVVAGPVQPISAQEVTLIEAFMAQGGALVVMEEPLPMTDFGDKQDPLAEYLTRSWGISLGMDVVVDLSSQQPLVAVANEYGTHPITEKLQGLVTYFPTARSVQVSNQIVGSTPTLLVLTSDQAWAESDLVGITQQDSQVQPDEGVELIGRVPLAVIAQREGTSERVVVFGDSDFAADSNFQSYGNGDLFVNSIDWASEQENLINLTPKEQVQRTLVPPQRYTLGLILFSSVFLLPGIVLIAGIVVFIQRRKRG